MILGCRMTAGVRKTRAASCSCVSLSLLQVTFIMLFVLTFYRPQIMLYQLSFVRPQSDSIQAGYFQGEISRGAAGNVAITMNTFESDAFNNETSFNNLSSPTTAESRQREMQERYHTYCKQHGTTMRATSEYMYNSQPQGMMVVDKYKMLLCRNAKVGYTNWKQLIISINSNSSTTIQKHKLHARALDKYSPELAQTKHYTSAEVQKRLKNYFKMMFVRHPLDRLLSAYEDKLGPRSTTSARYLEENGAAIILKCGNQSAADAIRLSGKPPTNVTFSEFLCYVSQQDYTTMNWHWKPYWAFCQLCHSSWSYDFIGEYEHISEDANYVLDLLGENNLRYPTSGYRTDAERRQRFMASYDSVPDATIKAVYERFQIDFDMFGYNLYPKFWYTN